MADYKIFETKQFQDDLRRLAKAGQGRLERKLHSTLYPQLRVHPHFGTNVRRLTGYEPPTWRYRIGDWRFFYEIDEDRRVVSLTAAHHRGAAY